MTSKNIIDAFITMNIKTDRDMKMKSHRPGFTDLTDLCRPLSLDMRSHDLARSSID